MKTKRSDALFLRAQACIPGGVNSPVRAFRSVNRHPLFIKKAKGPWLWDEDGNKFLDYVGSWGPMLLGHAHPPIVNALRTAAARGTSFGAPTQLEVRMAELIRSMVPSVEMVRMVNSGTEATMSAIRLARAFTGKDKILKFEGCYHGHGDSFLIKAGSGAMTMGVPDSPGVPSSVANGTLTAPYNDLATVRKMFDQSAGQIAAVIVEPVVGNMGCVLPASGFLEGLRALCTQYHALLIFDEVMTGFRLAPGGAQELFGIKPDLTTLGKIIGGGLPVGAYGGRRDIMEMVAPSGPVYQAGTLSGNPLAMAAGYVMLTIIVEIQIRVPDRWSSAGSNWRKESDQTFNKLGLNYTFNRAGSMFTLFFTDRPVTDFATAALSDRTTFAAYFNAMLEQGIYLPPSQFEAAFISTEHSESLIKKTIKANFKALKALQSIR